MILPGRMRCMNKICINQNWYFIPENELDCFNQFGFEKYADAIGAPARFYDHPAWAKVDLPHDWAVALPVDMRANTFAGARPNTRWHRYMTERRSECDEVFCIGWYRKHFTPEANWAGKRVFVEFEGVFLDAMVWVNGVYLDRHASGYTSFMIELTDHLVFGEENSIAVRVDSTQNEGWWYEGAGIYRNVFLHIAEPVYVQPRTLTILTSPDGTVEAACTVVNDTGEPFEGDILFAVDDQTAVCSTSIPPCATAQVSAVLRIPQPRLWHADDPYLYTLTVSAGNEVHKEPFGIRTVAFDPDRGFLLNGEPFKLRGACVHQDFGGVGVALTDDLQYYKIRRLKEMGVNAYRCSHNAPAPALLRACDELGMLVMDETRLFGTSPEAVRQLTDVITRDRNHPCVFIWSLGNEEFSVQDESWSYRLMEKMSRIAKQLDPTRPVTYSGNNGPSFEGANGASEVRGVNYIRNDGGEGGLWLDKYHAAHPSQPIVGTEESSYVLSRSGAVTDLGSRRLDATGLVTMPWGSTPKGWVKYFEERPYLAGSFMWTGFDYRGEPNPFITANIASSFGTIDLCGMEKPPFWYYQAWWTDKPVLRLAPHWNHQPGDVAAIALFTNCEEVSVFLNGRLVETVPVKRWDAPMLRIPYEAGVLRAEGVRNGAVYTFELRTSGPAAQLECTCVQEAHGPQDTAIYELRAQDEAGLFCPTAANMAEVTVSGGGLIGAGAGDPACTLPEQLPPVEDTMEIRTFTAADGSLYTIPPKEPNKLRRRHDWLETEPAGSGFEDDVRHVARFAESRFPPVCETFTTRIEGAEGYDYIEFERLGGNARVFLNGEEIGGNIRRSGRISISHVRPYRFAARFRAGTNELRVESERREFDGPAMSGRVRIGRIRRQDTVQVRLYDGTARVFVRGKAKISARLIDGR